MYRFFLRDFRTVVLQNLVTNSSYEVLIVYDRFLQRVLLEMSDGGRHLSTQVRSFSPASDETQILPVPPTPRVICYLGDVSQRGIRFLSQSPS